MATDASVNASGTLLWGGGTRPLEASYGKLMMWFFLVSDALSFSGFLTAYGLIRFKYLESWPIAEQVFTHFPGIQHDQPLLYVALMTFILIMSSVTMVMAVDAGHRMNQKDVIIWLAATIVGGAIFLGSQAWEWMHFINGGKGAVQIAQYEVYHAVNAEGHQLALYDVVHGDADHGHGGHHAHVSTEEFVQAFKMNEEVYLRAPGNGEANILSREESLSMLSEAEVIYGANMTRNEYGRTNFANFFFFITGFHGFHVFSGVIINLVIFIGVVFGVYQKRGHYEMVEKAGLYWHFVDLVWVFVFTFFYLV